MQGWHYGEGLIYLGPIFRRTKLVFFKARATLKENTISTPKTCFNNFFSDVRDQESGTLSKREIKSKVLNPESAIVLTKDFKSCQIFIKILWSEKAALTACIIRREFPWSWKIYKDPIFLQKMERLDFKSDFLTANSKAC